jgi:CMP-N-acetylneuraminic acid synthetase
MEKFLAIIPARGGSKGIPRKNIKLLKGKPLIFYTIKAALDCKKIDRVVVSTEDKEIAMISLKLGAEVPCLRPKQLAADKAPTLPVLQHMVDFLNKKENYHPDAVLTLQPTSPLRTKKHLDEAIDIFLKDKKADSLVSVVKVPHNMVPESIMRLKGGYLEDYFAGKTVLRRQEKPTYYARNGAAIYITKTKKLKNYIRGGKVLPYFMSKLESVDVDDLEDWKLVEKLI